MQYYFKNYFFFKFSTFWCKDSKYFFTLLTSLFLSMLFLFCSAAMQAQAMSLPYIRGTTNTAAALDYLVDTMFTNGNGDRSDVNNVVVFMTDGNSNDKDATVTAAMRVKSDNIHIITVQVMVYVLIFTDLKMCLFESKIYILLASK